MAKMERDLLSGLPPELRRLIGELTKREDLKSLRTVSKSWNDVATPILFSQFSFRLHMTETEWAQRPKFVSGSLVTTLYVTTIEYEDLNWHEYNNNLDYDHPLGENPVGDRRHVKQAFATYRKLRKNHRKALEQRHCLAYLTSLLSLMANLRKVVLTGDNNAVHKNHPFAKEYDHCSLPDCDYPSSQEYLGEHAALAVPPRSGLIDLGKTHVQILLLALATTKSPVTELTVQSADDYIELLYTALDLPATPHNLDVLSKLTKLELTFCVPYSHTDLDVFRTINGKDVSCVAYTLSYATNLRRLRLSLENTGECDDEFINLDLVSRGCNLPKLTTCILDSWQTSYETVSNFVRGSPKLAHLHLRDMFLDTTLACLRNDLSKVRPGLAVYPW
ncbi:MAG: hypothetical protein Q9209_005007 [Squamulea sp. 1 TL-2023]